MVNEFRLLFNLTPAKLQKSALRLHGTLIAKRGAEARGRNEKGVVSNYMFVGIEHRGYSSWSTNAAETQLRRAAL